MTETADKDWWIKCPHPDCGWYFERGSKCKNKIHKPKKPPKPKRTKLKRGPRPMWKHTGISKWFKPKPPKPKKPPVTLTRVLNEQERETWTKDQTFRKELVQKLEAEAKGLGLKYVNVKTAERQLLTSWVVGQLLT